MRAIGKKTMILADEQVFYLSFFTPIFFKMISISKHRFLVFFMAGLLATLLFSCANAEPIAACLKGEQYGFFYGLLHGFITPVSFVASLFDDGVAIYAVNNSGTWYDLGFLLGSGGWGFLAGNKSKKG